MYRFLGPQFPVFDDMNVFPPPGMGYYSYRSFMTCFREEEWSRRGQSDLPASAGVFLFCFVFVNSFSLRYYYPKVPYFG